MKAKKKEQEAAKKIEQVQALQVQERNIQKAQEVVLTSAHYLPLCVVCVCVCVSIHVHDKIRAYLERFIKVRQNGRTNREEEQRERKKIG